MDWGERGFSVVQNALRAILLVDDTAQSSTALRVGSAEGDDSRGFPQTLQQGCDTIEERRVDLHQLADRGHSVDDRRVVATSEQPPDFGQERSVSSRTGTSRPAARASG